MPFLGHSAKWRRTGMGVLSQFALKLSNAKDTLYVREAPWGF